MSDLMREEFEVAFVAEDVRRCGEGMRSSALYMVEQDTVNVRSAWWAWQASRECLVIELPRPVEVEVVGVGCTCNSEYFDIERVKESVHAAGVKTK